MSSSLFGTDGVRGVAGEYPMDAVFAYHLAEILSYTACLKKKKAVIGKDTRISGDMLEAALCAGFTANGVDVSLLGIVPTPLMTMMISELDADMALIITASHNPYQDNGIKLITSDGTKFPDEFYAATEEKLKTDGNIKNKSQTFGKIYRNATVCDEYIQKMLNIVPNNQNFKELNIVIDCANGAFSAIMPQVFSALGATVTAIGNRPDGYNINRECGSQHPEQLIKKVKDVQADFGIAVDGDGDRIILVDDEGNLIDGDQLLCFLALYLKKHNLLVNNTVISTEWSNLGLRNYLNRNGFLSFQSKVGERYVIDMMKEKSAVLGGEPVGHIVLSQFARSGDALAVAIVLALAFLEENHKMSEIFPLFKPYPCRIENIRFATKELMQKSVDYDDVRKALADARQALGADSNLIARKSGTEPVIKLRVEGQNEALVNSLSLSLKEIICRHLI